MSKSDTIQAEEAKALLLEVAQLREENRKLQERVEELTSLSDQDPLLKIFNRRAFLRELGRVQAYCRRHSLDSSVVFFDLDHLASINNRYGHDAGDAALRLVRDVVVESIRSSDILGRIGGDEFGLILVGADNESAMNKMQVIAGRLAQRSFHSGISSEGLQVSITFGVGEVVQEASPEALIAQADKAYYDRKGRNRVRQL